MSDGTLARCLSDEDDYWALDEVHEGISGDKINWILKRQNLFWPTLTKDCFKLAEGCRECQKHDNTQHLLAASRWAALYHQTMTFLRMNFRLNW